MHVFGSTGQGSEMCVQDHSLDLQEKPSVDDGYTRNMGVQIHGVIEVKSVVRRRRADLEARTSACSIISRFHQWRA